MSRRADSDTADSQPTNTQTRTYPLHLTDDNPTYELSLDEYRECVNTWDESERQGFRVYYTNEFSQEEYALTRYNGSMHGEQEYLLAIGPLSIRPILPDFEAVNETLADRGVEPYADTQQQILKDAYRTLTINGLRDCLFDGTVEVVESTVYATSGDWPDGLRYSIEETLKGRKWRDELNATDDDDAFITLDEGEVPSPSDVFSEAQLANLDAVEAGLRRPHEIHPTAGTHLVATLDFRLFEDWELRALEYLQNSILANKTALARTKALLEDGLSQAEIARQLGKDRSTISRQVSKINTWEQRAYWTLTETGDIQE